VESLKVTYDSVFNNKKMILNKLLVCKRNFFGTRLFSYVVLELT
jgi:hypothetical protein